MIYLVIFNKLKRATFVTFLQHTEGYKVQK